MGYMVNGARFRGQSRPRVRLARRRWAHYVCDMIDVCSMIDQPSPNHGPRPPGAHIDMVVIHSTGMESAEAALARMCDPRAEVSAHYMIGEDGTVWRLVAEEMRAWHAGVSRWAGADNINDISIGIELVNPGHEFGYRPFPAAQMAAVLGLGGDIVRRHGIAPARVLGHSDVAPGRRQDPGELFGWAALARDGIGLWPDAPDPAPSPDIAPDIAEAQRHLAQFGYDIAATGTLDDAGRQVVAAFQRHWRPALIDGAIDADTARRIEALCDLVKA